MFLEVDGIVGIIDLTDNKAFLIHGAAGGLYFGILEYITQFAYVIGILGRTFRRNIHQVRTVHFENLAEQIPFCLCSGMEHFDEMDAVVPVDGFCHERLQGSGLTVKVNHAFLYICPLLAELLENLSLCYLGIQAQQLVNVVFDAFKPFFGCGKIQQLIHC